MTPTAPGGQEKKRRPSPALIDEPRHFRDDPEVEEPEADVAAEEVEGAPAAAPAEPDLVSEPAHFRQDPAAPQDEDPRRS